MRISLALTAALVLAATLVPAAAQAQYQNRYLNAAMKLYGDLEFESALDSLKKAAAQPNNTDAEDVQISLFTGLIQFELGDVNAAESAFKKALAFDENVTLPKGVSPKVSAAFDKARKEILKSKPPKPTQTTVTPSPKPDQPPPNTTTTTATVVPIAPPTPLGPEPKKETGPNVALALGVGIPLIAIGAGLLGGGGYFGAQMNNDVNSARSATFQSDAQDSLNKAHTDSTNANVMLGVGTAVAVAGVVTLVAILATSHEAVTPASEPLPH
jgi:tetratricopeptide (TPR) repeat protein